jgi:hypothetical protein
MKATVAIALLLGASIAFAKDKPCQVATEGNSPIAQACAEGGRDAAKHKMKELVKAANKNGGDFKCGRCHESTKTFELKDNAPDDLEKLLQIAGHQ